MVRKNTTAGAAEALVPFLKRARGARSPQRRASATFALHQSWRVPHPQAAKNRSRLISSMLLMIRFTILVILNFGFVACFAILTKYRQQVLSHFHFPKCKLSRVRQMMTRRDTHPVAVRMVVAHQHQDSAIASEAVALAGRGE